MDSRVNLLATRTKGRRQVKNDPNPVRHGPTGTQQKVQSYPYVCVTEVVTVEKVSYDWFVAMKDESRQVIAGSLR